MLIKLNYFSQYKTDIWCARKILPQFSAMLFSMCPLEIFRAIRATFWSPGGLKIFETSNLPASGSTNRLDPANETSAPLVAARIFLFFFERKVPKNAGIYDTNNHLPDVTRVTQPCWGLEYLKGRVFLFFPCGQHSRKCKII